MKGIRYANSKLEHNMANTYYVYILRCADVLSLRLSVPLAIKARKLFTEKEQASGSASCVHSDLSEAAGV